MNLVSITQQILQALGFDDASITFDEEGRKIIIFINEGEWLKTHIGDLIKTLEHIISIIAKKEKLSGEPIFVDINNYRKQRENLIIELAKAAAQKAVATKEPVSLPPMNSYERRLIHKELATRPDIKTESDGIGKDRHVVVKVL